MIKGNKKFFYVFILYLFAGFLFFSPQLKGKFVFDDVRVILDASKIGSFKAYIKKRPVNIVNPDSPVYWGIILSEYIFWGKDPSGYKIVNLFAHVLTAFFFFLFLNDFIEILNENSDKKHFGNKKIKLKRNKKEDPVFYFSLFCGLFFLLHPVTVETVATITGVSNGFGGLFFIAASYFFLKGLKSSLKKGSTLYFLISILFFILSFLTKELYVVFPVFCTIVYVFLKPREKKRLFFSGVIVFLFFLFLFGGAFVFNFSPFTIIRSRLLRALPSVPVALATNAFASLYSLYLMIFPVPLNIDHGLPIIHSFLDFHVIGSIFVIGGLFAFLLKFRSRFKLSFFAFLSYFLMMAPSNSFILRGTPLWGYDPLSERNLYAPAMFFAVFMAEFLWNLFNKDLNKFKVVAFLIIILFSFRTFVRCNDFKDDVSVWSKAVKYCPDRARANFSLSNALNREGDIDGAIKYATKAFRLHPSPLTLEFLARLYLKKGDRDTFESLIDTAIEKKGFRDANLFHTFGEYYYQNGNFDKAEKWFLLALRKNRNHLLARLSLTYVYLNEGKPQNAKKHLNFLNRVIKKISDGVFGGFVVDNVFKSRVYFANALYYFLISKPEKGVKFCKKSIELNPLFTEPYVKLGQYFFLKGDYKNALMFLKKAEKTPDYYRYKDDILIMKNEILKNKPR